MDLVRGCSPKSTIAFKISAQMEEPAIKTALPYPIPEDLVKLIVESQPRLGSLLVSTIELTIRESQNHYADIFRSLKPLLRDDTEDFLSKIFAFRKGSSRDDDTGLQPGQSEKPAKHQNSEVVFNRVDESVYTLEELREYATRYGSLNCLRRLNRGKYLIIYDSPSSAQRLIECTEAVLGDCDIKKFYNINLQLDLHRRVDIHGLLQEQQLLLDKISHSRDGELLSSLKFITHRIRAYILNKESKAENKPHKKGKAPRSAQNIESSLYYNMFNE